MAVSKIIVIMLSTAFICSCWIPPKSRLHAVSVPENSLRVAEVDSFATRDEILNMPIVVETLATVGIQRKNITDNLIGSGHVFCCGGPNEQDQAIWFYIPQSIPVGIRDIVEIRSGPEVRSGNNVPAPPNTVTRVIQKPSDKVRHCRWVPEDERLWARVLYCDWMKSEGWEQQSGLFNVWVKTVK
jgi:hypothetical protein